MTDWLRVQLQSLLERADPGVWGEEAPQDGISVLRSTNFNNDGTLDLSKLALRDILEAKRESKALREGDIILERSGGGPDQPVGRVCFFAGDDRPHVFGNFCQRLRAAKSLCNPRFLFWYLYWFHATGKTLRFQKQTTGIRNLEYKHYLTQTLDLPSISEQIRIAGILDQADALRRARRQANLVADRVLPAIFTRLFGQPDAWGENQVEPLGELVEMRGGGTPSKQNPAYWEGDIPWVSPKDMKRDFLDDAEDHITPLAFEETNTSLVPAQSVLIVVRGMILARHVPTAMNLRPVAINQDMKALALRDGRLAPLYLFAAIRAQSQRLYANVTTAAHGTRKLDTEWLLSLPILMPEPHKLGQFLRCCEAIQTINTSLEGSGPGLDRLFDVLLHRAISGTLTSGWRTSHEAEVNAEMRGQRAALDRATMSGGAVPSANHDESNDAEPVEGEHAGHSAFNKAALLTYIVSRCHSAQYPQAMTRVRVAKLFYLAQRRGEVSLTRQFDRQAAGPLDHDWFKVISLGKKQGWLAEVPSAGKIKPLSPGEKSAVAVEHVRKRFADATATIDAMLETMKRWSADALERWATVDEAATELRRQGKPASSATVKEFIASHPKWKAKLERQAFSDFNIESTLRGLRDQGFLPS